MRGRDGDLGQWPDAAIEDITWSTGDSVAAITVDSSGIYWVTALNPQGCTRTDTVQVDIYTDPVLTLEAGTAACLGQPVNLVGLVDSDTTVAGIGWSSGSGDDHHGDGARFV